MRYRSYYFASFRTSVNVLVVLKRCKESCFSAFSSPQGLQAGGQNKVVVLAARATISLRTLQVSISIG